jgi:hypothetical protein
MTPFWFAENFPYAVKEYLTMLAKRCQSSILIQASTL